MNKNVINIRIEQEVKDAIEFLKSRGYSVPFKIKMYLIQLAEAERNNELIGKKFIISD